MADYKGRSIRTVRAGRLIRARIMATALLSSWAGLLLWCSWILDWETLSVVLLYAAKFGLVVFALVPLAALYIILED